ncbi:MAG: hypothetical protein QOG54_1552 [Actinomycetota bacterium]|jgi:spore germination protein GerM|nr:hypothetical protein [Actinomycetota bacterium]
MEKKTATSRLVLLILAVVLVAGACGSNPEPTNGTGSQPTANDPSSESTDDPFVEPTEEPESETTFVTLWETDREFLAPSVRPIDKTERIGTAALELLMQGPISDAHGTAIPGDVQVLGLTIDNGEATVDLSSGFESGGGSLSMRMRVAQVVYTLTEFPTVKTVFFKLDGQPVEAIGGEGVFVGNGVARRDFEDFRPIITVDSPAPGESVSSPIHISGEANVFEANVSIQILDENGKVIKEAFTTATCGTGCWGTYETDVKYSVDHTQQGTVIVFESSAEDGSMLFPVEIPVTLTA